MVRKEAEISNLYSSAGDSRMVIFWDVERICNFLAPSCQPIKSLESTKKWLQIRSHQISTRRPSDWYFCDILRSHPRYRYSVGLSIQTVLNVAVMDVSNIVWRPNSPVMACHQCLAEYFLQFVPSQKGIQSS